MAPNALVDPFCRNQKKCGTERVNEFLSCQLGAHSPSKGGHSFRPVKNRWEEKSTSVFLSLHFLHTLHSQAQIFFYKFKISKNMVFPQKHCQAVIILGM